MAYYSSNNEVVPLIMIVNIFHGLLSIKNRLIHSNDAKGSKEAVTVKELKISTKILLRMDKLLQVSEI